jgi:hypothetical protein
MKRNGQGDSGQRYFVATGNIWAIGQTVTAKPRSRGQRVWRFWGGLGWLLWTFLRFVPYVASVLLLFVGLILYAGSWFLPGLSVHLRAVWITCGLCFAASSVAQILWEISVVRGAQRSLRGEERNE